MHKMFKDRRSIRAYTAEPIPHHVLTDILEAGRIAPSSKNRQPWHFTVVSGASKESLLQAMAEGLIRETSQPFLPESAAYIAGAKHTLSIMKQAPVIILITNPIGSPIGKPLSVDAHVSELCNAQSAGAAIENMCLAAAEHGLGSLWICDIYFSYPELMHWLQKPGILLAALALGWPAESPSPRPRKEISDVIEWRG